MTRIYISSEYIGKMRPQFEEDHRPYDEQQHRERPEVEGPPRVLPKPCPIQEASAIPLDDVEHRIEFDKRFIVIRNRPVIPENGSHPEPDLQQHVHNLADVSYENHDGGGNPRKADQKDEAREQVVKNLQVSDGQAVSMEDQHDQEQDDEKGMHEKRRRDLDEGNDGRAEYNLLHEITVGKDRRGRAAETFLEEEPWDHRGHQPEYERVSVRRHGAEPDLEYEIHDDDRDEGLNERPYEIEVRTQVVGCKISPGKIEDQLPASEYSSQEITEAPA